MSNVQRPYTDANAASRDQHALNRLIGGTGGDVMATRQVGDALDFGGSATGTVFDDVSATGFGTLITCDGFESVVLKIEGEKSGATIKVRPWWVDASGEYVPGEKITAAATGTQDSVDSPALMTNYYHYEVLSIPTMGAKQLRVELTNLSNGKVSVWGTPR